MQLCWAHLKRDILGIAEDARSRSAQQFGRDALAVVARLFRLWYRFRGDLRGIGGGNRSPSNGGSSLGKRDRERTRLKSSHRHNSYARLCFEKKKKYIDRSYIVEYSLQI